jgi:hypothetical protein
MRPRVAARSPMSGAPLPATHAGACTDERARPWSRRSPPACRWGMWVGAIAAGLFISSCSAPPSVAPGPRVTARSAMRGASLPVVEAIIDKRARPLSRRSPRTFRCRTLAAVFTPVRASPPSVCDAPARRGAQVDERRSVAGDGGPVPEAPSSSSAHTNTVVSGHRQHR